MPSWKKVILSGSDAALNSIQLNTSPSPTPTTQGSIFWNPDNLAISVILNGYIQTVGEDQFYPVKNQTGALIPKGTAVRFAGTVGMSGRLLITPYLADGAGPSTFFMGVTAEDIANGADGKVIWFGRIRGINTNAFNEGDVLYASTTTAGGFQTTVPQAPNNIVQVAAVITKSATVGTIFVRPTIGSNINKDEGVKITSGSTGDLLQLQSNGLWENKTLSQAGIQPTLTNPITGTGTSGQVSFFTGTTTQAGDNGLFWDNTNKRLGIGTTSPSSRLQVRGTGTTASTVALRVENNNGSGSLIVNDAGDVYNNGVQGVTSNTFFGENVGRVATGDNNAAFGLQALFSNTTGTRNSAFGREALRNNTTGISNSAFGLQALFSNTTGISNSAFGREALRNNTTGISNSAFGVNALRDNTTGGSNSAFGGSALRNNTTGRSNIGLGFEAGRRIANGSNNTITNNSIYIGVDTRAAANNQTNQIVIGHNAIGLGSNTTVLGNSSTVTTALYGNVGIGTTSPTSPLDVQCNASALGVNIRQRSGDDFSNLVFSNSTNTALGSVGYVGTSRLRFTTNGLGDANEKLSILANGNIGIGTTSPSTALHIARAAATAPIIRLQTTDSTTNGNIQWTNSANSILVRIGSNMAVGDSGGNLEFQTGGTNSRMLITSTGNVGIGTTSPTSRLDIIPTANQTALGITGYSLTGANAQPALDITGTWNTTGTPTAIKLNVTNTASNANSLLMDLQVGGSSVCNINASTSVARVARSGGGAGFRFNDTSGANREGSLTLSGPGTRVEFGMGSGITNGFGIINSGGWTTLGSTNGTGQNNEIRIGTNGVNSTGFPSALLVGANFAPTSGTTTWTLSQIAPTINQTGGANGITRGLFINPTLTSAADWRSIELTNNTGFGIFQSGTATNSFAGNVGIGTTSPSAKLDVQGTLIVSSSILQYSNNASITSGSTANVASFSTGSYTAGFFDYVATSGTNARAGTVFTVWNANNVEFTETSTNDIGNTSNLVLSASLSAGAIRLQATSLSGSWSVKTLARML